MTDFVLNEYKKIMNTPYNDSVLTAFDAEKFVKYAKFLKQPLKLEMFVPCDQNGNILSEPEMIEKRLGFDEVELDYNYAEVEVHKKAKEKVLFVHKPQFSIDAIKHHIEQSRTIEYLANFGELELTESAIKQIGL